LSVYEYMRKTESRKIRLDHLKMKLGIMLYWHHLFGYPQLK
jgi:hypothetical protein